MNSLRPPSPPPPDAAGTGRDAPLRAGPLIQVIFMAGATVVMILATLFLLLMPDVLVALILE